MKTSLPFSVASVPLWLILLSAGLAGAQEPPRVVVSGEARLATPPEQSGLDVTVVKAEDLAAAPALRLDDLLRDRVPGFSLFRRNGSRTANPTAQGVSLRNIGPSGAGRTLVLLDGIPQNDPFGGWVYWSRLPVASIGRVEVTQGGGAGLWGNAALGGTIELISAEPAGDAWRLELTGGNRGTYEADVAGSVAVPLANGRSVRLFGRADRFSTDGYPTVRAGQRGPVDIAADAHADILDGGVRWEIGDATALTLKVGGFQEDRGNGTPLTNNSTRALDFSAALDGAVRDRGIVWQAQIYGQWREFSSTFSAVNDTRTAETPSLDQSSVPAHALGGSVALRLPLGDSHRLGLGADVRTVTGETRERFRFIGDRFTMNRAAGGEQFFVGLFAEDAWKLGPRTTLTAAGRLDWHADTDGHRRERDLATGAVTRDDRFADRDGLTFNARLGGTHDLLAEPGALRIRAAAYSGFRVPTLNELYRPFRVRNDVTEANPALSPERLYGAEAGVQWKPASAWTLSATAFHNELHRPVANVTLAQGPSNTPLFGALPAGGVGRQRQNLGRARIIGAQAEVAWTPTKAWRFEASYLFTRAEVERAESQPVLEGKRLAQTPLHQLTAGARWTEGRWQASAQLRFSGEQFEDDLNTLRLAPAVTLDAAVSYRFTANWLARVSVENLLNQRAEAGRTADGLVTEGQPRLVSGGVRREW